MKLIKIKLKVILRKLKSLRLRQICLMREENGSKNSCKCMNFLIYQEMQVIFIKKEKWNNKDKLEIKKQMLLKKTTRENKKKEEEKVKRTMLISSYKIMLKLDLLNKLLNFNKKLNNTTIFGVIVIQMKSLLKFMTLN